MKSENLVLIAVRTTCETYQQKINEKEIIEIGLCLLEQNGKRHEPISFFIKPKKRSVSEHCTRITGITPEDARNGATIEEVYDYFRRAYASHTLPWACYGTFTRQCLDASTNYNSNKLPLSSNWTNLQKEFAKQFNLDCGLKAAMTKIGLKEIPNLSCEDEVLNMGILCNYLIQSSK